MVLIAENETWTLSRRRLGADIAGELCHCSISLDRQHIRSLSKDFS